MKRRKRVPQIRPTSGKAIKYYADYQIDWSQKVVVSKKYILKSVEFLTIAGDAPKDLVVDREYRKGHRSRQRPTDTYIAKVGSKFYPLESIIEQLITRIGESFKLNIARSKLRIIDGQVRFLSRYFLRRGEQLTHGAEIYEYSLGKENYQELSDAKGEADFFTFQMTCETIHELFPLEAEKIVRGYVEMLVFDALIGHNDRHPYNWGVIVPIRKKTKPRFAPIFDTARALLWNKPDDKLVIMHSDRQSFDAYIKKCTPPIGWDGAKNIAFFELIGLLWKEFPIYRDSIEKFLDPTVLDTIDGVLDSEFRQLMTPIRYELITRCLHHRQEILIATIAHHRGE